VLEKELLIALDALTAQLEVPNNDPLKDPVKLPDAITVVVVEVPSKASITFNMSEACIVFPVTTLVLLISAIYVYCVI